MRVREITMAGNIGSASGGADWAEHVKTYNGFIWLLKFSASLSAVTLLLLFLVFAR
jgi:hypothetical protein